MTSSVGEQLREARKRQGLSIEQVSRMTSVRSHYLEALENDQRDQLPSNVQGRGFMRLYADALGLPVGPLLAAWEGKPFVATPPAPIDAPPPDLTIDAPLTDLSALGLPDPAVASAAVRAPDAPAQPTAAPDPATAYRLEEAAPAEFPDEVDAAQPVFLHETGAEQAGEAAPGSSRAVFEEIGELLRRQREALGLSRAEVERYTRLRQHYIQALEEGRLEGMPSPVQGRGMLSNYAAFLNLDEERLLLRFAEGLQIRRIERAPAPEPQGLFTNKKRPAREAGAWRRLITMDLVFGVVLAITVFFLLIWMASGVTEKMRTAGSEPTTPPIAEILLQTATVEITGEGTVEPEMTSVAGENAEAGPTPDGSTNVSPEGLEQATLPADSVAGPIAAGEPVPTLLPVATDGPDVTPTMPPAGSAPLQVYVVTRQRAWMQVIVDGKVEFQGRTIPGNAYAFSGTKRIELLSGNASALQVFYNQNDLGLLGGSGQALSLVFEPGGAMMTPTPAFTSTPTATAPATVTPLPSPTLPATPTITPFVPGG